MKACPGARAAREWTPAKAGIRRAARLAGVLAVAAFLGLDPVAGAAQTAGVADLANRVDRLQRELDALQRAVHGNRPPPAAAVPGGAGRAADGPRTSARNSVRLSQLETEIRTLTGLIEELDHRLRRLEGRIAELEEPPAAAAAAPDPEGPEQDAASAGPPAAAGDPVLGAPEGVLGTIAGDRAAAGTAVSPAPGTAEPVLPEGSPQERYDFALDLMLDKNDYATAGKALSEFLERHPGHRLAGNAYYWLGETRYVRKDFRGAALAFGEGFRRHSRGPKAPETLLRLGMALAELGKRKEACTAFKTLAERFPEAAPRLGGRIAHERNRSECR